MNICDRCLPESKLFFEADEPPGSEEEDWGKWLEEGQQLQTTPFDFHLGRGQIYYSYPDSITGFIPNDFNVSLPNSGFQLESAQTVDINIFMNIENWFKNPSIYDHDVWGGYIMQNQEAMQLVKENGINVFSVEIIKW